MERELVADRKKMEEHFTTGQSPQWVVVPMQEEVSGDQLRSYTASYYGRYSWSWLPN